MGSSGSKKKTTELTDLKEAIKINQDNKIIEPIKINKAKNINDRVEECKILASSPFEKIGPDLKDISRSICKIKIKTIIGTIIGTGFLIKFNIDQEKIYCLISNKHVIENDIIKNNNNIIYISYDNEDKYAAIKLGSKKRYIKSFIDIDLDITIVEILEEDNISKDCFLLYLSENMLNNSLINNEIFIPQYPGGKELVNARGIIKEINKYEFTHLVNTEKGSSGSPIFLEYYKKVIGIHKQGNVNKKENYGDFIYPAINIMENDIKKKRNNGKYINGKYIWEDDKYYIGEFKNNIPNGKGIKYYSNGNILYEGDFINGKFEGNGKYFYDDGDYFIGQYKNGLRNGKGIVYYSNGNIKFECNFINGKAEGIGKKILDDGDYFIGQYKNDLKNGKGIIYNKNGNIILEGNFINNEMMGMCKCILPNDNYFIGQ